MLLHTTTDDFLRNILILDTRDKAHVYPEGATAIAASLGKNTYIFTADQTTGVLSGFSLSYSTSHVRIIFNCYNNCLSNFRILNQFSIINPFRRNLSLTKYGNYYFRQRIKE